MKNKPIGILDSGLGGLTVLRSIAQELPHESFIYAGDSANTPYGVKSEEEIYLRAKKLIEFLLTKNVKLIVIACNTITVSCLDRLRSDYPDVPIIGTVPVIKTAAAVSQNKRIGILSTTGTAKSDYQKHLIEEFANGCIVFNHGTDDLVPLIEQGKAESEEMTIALKKVLTPFYNEHIDTLVLGCTHFPFLEEQMGQILGPTINLLDSGGAIARQVQRVLEHNNNVSTGDKREIMIYTTGNTHIAKRIIKDTIESQPIQLKHLPMNTNIDWQKKKVAVLGLGLEGTAVVELLKKNGASIWVLDRRQKENIDHNLVTQVEELGAKVICGKEYLENLADYDVIFRSPGVRRLTPELVDAEKNGVTITSQTKLFFDLCPCPIIGVTGTKGKGTTSTLIYNMLKEAGMDAYLGGNIGVPPLTFLDALQPSSIVVLELSSFQLQDLEKSPHIGVMLMVTSEHLDHHATVEEYIDAKRNLLRFQTSDDFAIVNRDYPASNESDILTDGKLFYVSRERETNNGCFALNGKIIVKKNDNDDEIIDISEIALPGRHNLENVCAAVMAARLANVGKKHIIEVLKTFTGLTYRLELVSEINGVKYYNDSFSTTPETAIAAIAAFDRPKILILGGSSKGSDFTQLGKVIRESDSIKAIIGIGDEWLTIKDETGITTQNSKILLVEGAQDMKTIVKAASKIAKSGDVVLLTPACASFDMFKDYKDRGEQFKKEVLGLA